MKVKLRALAYGTTALVVSGLVAGIWGHGYTTGRDRTEDRYRAAQDRMQADLIRNADALSMRALEIQQMEAELSARAMEAEDAARADFDVCRVPSADSLRRLENRWGRSQRP